jgi:hypothetical protein
MSDESDDSEHDDIPRPFIELSGAEKLTSKFYEPSQKEKKNIPLFIRLTIGKEFALNGRGSVLLFTPACEGLNLDAKLSTVTDIFVDALQREIIKGGGLWVRSEGQVLDERST